MLPNKRNWNFYFQIQIEGTHVNNILPKETGNWKQNNSYKIQISVKHNNFTI